MLEEIQELYEDTLDEIDRLEDEGELSPEEADESRLASEEEYIDILEALLEGTPDMDDVDEDDYDGADYSDDSALAMFSVSNDLGGAIATLIDEQYESAEDGIEDLMDATGHDAETIIGIIQGQLAPDEDLVGAIADVFGLPHDARAGLGLLAQEALGEYFDDDEYDDEESDGLIEAIEERDAEYSAAFLRLQAENDALQAEFEAAQAVQDLNNELVAQEFRAQAGLEAGWLPPAIFDAEFRSFEVADDRVATFSTVCEANKIDAATELYAREKILDAFERFGPAINFGRSIIDEIDPEDEYDEFDATQAFSMAAVLNSRFPINDEDY